MTRILIADDQPDVLEALRLLLKGEGYHTESTTSPDGIVTAVKSKDFDLVLMDLNFARDTTSGQEGLDTLSRLASHGQHASRRGHDGLGKCGSGGRGDAARRPGFH